MKNIKGQEVKLIITDPVKGIREFDFDSMDFNADLELLQRDILGETTQRKDSILNGFSGSLSSLLRNSEFFEFQESLIDKATRRAPASTVYNVVASFAFPDGTRARLNFEDVEFGALNSSVGSRSDYVTTSIDWECSTRTRVG